MLETIKNVLIIDDKHHEVESLEIELKKQDIGVLYLTPEQALEEDCVLKQKDLLFLDFMLDDFEDKFKSIMSSKIRPLLKKHFSKKFPYGIVIWSKHEDKINSFLERLHKDTFEDREYDAPLFVIVLDKNHYLEIGNFQNVISDIEQKLRQSPAASFFYNWNSGISSAFYASVSDIYSLAADYKNHDEEIRKILYKLAISQTEIPKKELEKYIQENRLTDDAYKTMDEILCSNLRLSDRSSYDNLFLSAIQGEEPFEEKIKIASRLNTKLFINEISPSMTNVVPGNVYEILDSTSMLKLDDVPRKCKLIAIELSPPCDVVNKKKNNRLVGGFMLPAPSNETDYINKFKGHYSEKDQVYKPGTYSNAYYYVLHAMHLPKDENKAYAMIFDFRYFSSVSDADLHNSSKYKLLFKAKSNLFADILQKFSSHGARLGLAEMNLE